MSDVQSHYVCGHSARELQRLELQARFYEELTRRFLEAAGVAAGMRVLDVGSGAGDLSLLVADIVGPSGTVLGVDRDAKVVEVATSRAHARGLYNVQFQCATVDDPRPRAPVDALVGRFVLMHQADPALALQAAARHVRAGGVVAFLESHMSAAVAGVHSWPHAPTYHRVLRTMVDIVTAAGAHPDMGLRLRRTFLEAGLPEPQLWLQARVDGGADAEVYRYVAESLRSLLPLAERLGVDTLPAGDLDALETRLRDEALAAGGVLTSWLVVGAWCRV
jgi:ubiquinone/menaquinone biosynthesis C-methylase UbiE